MQLNVKIGSTAFKVEGEKEKVGLLAKMFNKIQQGERVTDFSVSVSEGEKEGVKVTRLGEYESVHKAVKSDSDNVVLDMNTLKEVGSE